jgi:hypothetical protein
MSIFARKASELEKDVADVEEEIDELVSRDVAEPQQQPANDGELGSLLRRVSANSVQQIDCIINDLKMLRERLQHEGERIANEIIAYASLSQTAIQSTETISASLTKMDRTS